MKKKIISLLLCGALAVSITGCGKGAQSLTEEKKQSEKIEQTNVTKDDYQSVAQLGTQLLQQEVEKSEGGNVLISPVSLMAALSMTANGACDTTLEQMEEVLGMDAATLNSMNYEMLAEDSNADSQDNEKVDNEKDDSSKSDSNEGKNTYLRLANSVWLKDSDELDVKDEFLQKVTDYYGADVKTADFSEQTVKDINQWVSDKTDKKIKQIIGKIDGTSQMYLINALSFHGDWANPYESYQVQEDTFTTEDKKEQTVDMMYANLNTYLEDEDTTGFLEYYEGERYAFVALLPKEGMQMKDYVNELSGEKIQNLLTTSQEASVDTYLPKFETQSDMKLAQDLQSLGMKDAFDEDKADFSDMAVTKNGSLFIRDVLQKTYMKVDETGTEAGATTAVIMAEKACLMDPNDIKQVYLNRPFVYMIVDCENNTPVFLGVYMNAEEK